MTRHLKIRRARKKSTVWKKLHSFINRRRWEDGPEAYWFKKDAKVCLQLLPGKLVVDDYCHTVTLHAVMYNHEIHSFFPPPLFASPFIASHTLKLATSLYSTLDNLQGIPDTL